MKRLTLLFLAWIAGCNAIDERSRSPRPPARVTAEGRIRDVLVSWSPVDDVAGYTLHVSSNANWAQGFDAATESQSFDTAATSRVVATLSASQTYWFSLSTTASSEPSRPVSASIPAPADRLGPARWSILGNVGDNFGAAIAGIADMNGDGFGDVAVGSTGVEEVRRFLGAPFGAPVTSLLAQDSEPFETPVTGDGIGRAIGAIGDIDGDGFDDLAVGAPIHDSGLLTRGGLVLLVDGDSFPVGPASYGGDARERRLGTAIAGLGDRNGDGFDDFVVSGPGQAVISTSGELILFSGNPAGNPGFQVVPIGPDGPGFAKELANLGDVDGDGTDDLIVGVVGSGHVLVLTTTAADFDTRTTILTNGTGEMIVAAAGDVDDDGFADALAGFESDGQVWLLRGPFPDPYPKAGRRVIETCSTQSPIPEVRPMAMAGNGDVNGDGYADVLVGDPYFDPPGALNGGRAMLFLGGPQGLEAEPVATLVGAASELVGGAVAFIGDMDRDGFDEIGIGAPGASSLAGRFSLYQGHAGYGLFVDAGLPHIQRAGADAGLHTPSLRDPFGMGPYSITWDWGDGTSPDQYPDPENPCVEANLLRCRLHNYEKPGFYFVKVTVVSFDGRFGEAVTTLEIVR